MVLVELHCHTADSSPCGKVGAKEAMGLYREAGYGGVVITDHFSRRVCGNPEGQSWEAVVNRFLAGYREAREEGGRLGLCVYLGMELRFPQNDNDFLIYGLDEAYLMSHPWIYERNLGQLRQDMVREGIVIFQAHPFRQGCTPEDARLLDGVEIINDNKRRASHNDMAAAWAEEHGLPGICGSDFHRAGDATGAGVYFRALPQSGKELAKSLARGEYRMGRSLA